MKSKSKFLIGAVAIIIVIAGLALSATGADESKIDIVGSTSVQPVAEKLVEAYEQSHPDVKINVQGGGSSVGIKSAEEGSADIGMSSKELDEKSNLKEYELGKDGIVIAVNPDNSVSDLSNDQLKAIFSGEITNWKEVGGKDAPINVVTREEGSGTLDAFEGIVMGDSKIKDGAVVQSSTEAVKQSVAQNPNAIGFVSFAHMSDDVKALDINGVAPTSEAIADGTYELQRPFLFLTNGEPTGDVKEFIDWVLSKEGTKILEEEKVIKSEN